MGDLIRRVSRLFSLFFIVVISISAQTPVAFFPDIAISQLLTVKNSATRICYSTIDQSLYYLTYDGNIYKIQNSSGVSTDTLMYTSLDHGIQTCQGMVIKDSVIYISGNNDSAGVYSTGLILKGVLQFDNSRVWSVVAQTEAYPLAGQFDHLFSGLTLNKTEDTLLICSGSRGDHGEVRENGGLFPGTRNLALTSALLQIPLNANGLIISDDSTFLDAQQLVFARGIRNTYDFGYNAAGDLFGTENSGDRDQEDELNWLQKGHHYGFPWVMGGTDNPQQFSWFNPGSDLLINHLSSSWIQGAFTNDPDFPVRPPGLITDLPCLNLGPDGAFIRDSITGATYNAGALGQGIYSFTPHRSPLGIVFDNDSMLDGNYNGNAFVFSYTRGDSTLNGYSKLLSPFEDDGEDLLMLTMSKDLTNQRYTFQSTRIASNFSTPVDAVLLDTSIYMIEIGVSNTSSIWRIDFPRASHTGIPETENLPFLLYPNPCSEELNLNLKEANTGECRIKIYDTTGRIVKDYPQQSNRSVISLWLHDLTAGCYLLEFKSGKQTSYQQFVKD